MTLIRRIIEFTNMTILLNHRAPNRLCLYEPLMHDDAHDRLREPCDKENMMVGDKMQSAIDKTGPKRCPGSESTRSSPSQGIFPRNGG